MDFRIGQGYDIHPLVEGRELRLGGEVIPHERGLDGVSDADVLLHALGDALLGAAGLGDLGRHFPPDAAESRDLSSVDILRRIVELVHGRGYRVLNCDMTLIAEAPKISPYRESICRRVADLLDLDVEAVGLKATTNERLGALGRSEGMAALAVALLGRDTPAG